MIRDRSWLLQIFCDCLHLACHENGLWPTQFLGAGKRRTNQRATQARRQLIDEVRRRAAWKMHRGRKVYCDPEDGEPLSVKDLHHLTGLHESSITQYLNRRWEREEEDKRKPRSVETEPGFPRVKRES